MQKIKKSDIIMTIIIVYIAEVFSALSTFLPKTIFAESFIIDVWQVPEYVPKSDQDRYATT